MDLGRQTLEPWKFTNYQTPHLSASTENTGEKKITSLREDAQELHPSYHKPTKQKPKSHMHA